MSQFKSHKIVTLTLALAFSLTFFACTNVLAQTHNLQELIDTMGDFTVGDKRFYNFSYSDTGQMPSASEVNVVEIFDGQGNPGIRFTGTFLDLPLGDPNDGSDALITFRVDAPGPFITDAHLLANPNLLGDTIGSVSITEDIFGVSNGVLGPHLARLESFNEDFGGGETLVLNDWADFSQPWQTIEVRKDIAALGFDGSATLSFVDQTFSQVPEPTTAMLMMIGLAAVSMVRRKRA